MDSGRPPPHGVVVIEDFLDREQCRVLVDYAATRPSRRLKVIDRDASSVTGQIKRKLDDRRVTERVHMGEHEGAITERLHSIWTETIAPRVGRSFGWFEAPQMLKYMVGGFYAAHSDADSYEPESGRWRQDLDRDMSMLLYLNEEFEGGDLSFEHFNYRLAPKPGMLVWFPSDARYFHGANPVTAGTRYAIVSWAAFADTPKVRQVLPQHAVVLDPRYSAP
jgi:predicted 2-oxoglutarate/Fe(II)-dependent dioxygenase YbiX